ncbi:hypothetical protein [Rhodopirellula halodulae]|uniref:hypothetical protein n=1 Tax=Rhodopirellula halodulae TaxID=2894198 RepID=UPI001E4E7212|nr:hypothetical protein [Rhodopirellula sp. JC737]MCC9655269.1 hypothetical protein [Rhodopirellula sp. JC737]
MAILDLTLDSDCPPIEVYTVLRSVTGISVGQLRQRASSRSPVVVWDTDDFPLASERERHRATILDAINRLMSCKCGFRLDYRPAPEDDAETVSIAMLENLFKAEIEYDNQTYD